MTAHVFWPALALPLMVTAATLAGVASNRASARDPIDLTHREVSVSPGGREDSSTTLWLSWHGAPAVRETWLDREKLRALGFDVSVDPAAPRAAAHYGRLLQRERFVVFELDGPAWPAFLAIAERGQTEPGSPRFVDSLREGGSRLVAVDADIDGTELAARYPSARTHLITAAFISARRMEIRGEAPYVYGSIDNIAPNRINVSREWAPLLPPRRPDGRPSPFAVSIRYGRHLEPWVVGVK